MRYCTSLSHGPGRRANREHSGMNASTGGSQRQRPTGLRRVGVLTALCDRRQARMCRPVDTMSIRGRVPGAKGWDLRSW